MPTPEQEVLGSGWNHVVQGGRIVKDQATSSPTPKNEPDTLEKMLLKIGVLNMVWPLTKHNCAFRADTVADFN
jgi:hypothetical protein